jgi:hypothetical protein
MKKFLNRFSDKIYIIWFVHTVYVYIIFLFKMKVVLF